MTEDLKVIVTNVNDILKTNYNLISFDSLSIENLIQLLIDVLHHFGATAKIDIKDTDPADTNQCIIDCLKKIQYHPNTVQNDPGAFRRNLLQGDKKTIYPILRYIFENADTIRNLTYLAQYLIPINLPPEALANPDIANLWNEYQMIMNEFKEAHKIHQNSVKENVQFRELRSDINIIETEKENVKKRIERTQSRLDKIPQQELLLETAHALRVERGRQKELQTQLENQRQGVQRATMIQDRLQKDLNNARNSSQDISPQYLLENIIGETQVLEFMVKEKLPKELQTKQSEVQVLEDVINNPNISREYLQDLQTKIDKINRDVQKIMEHQITERGNNSENLMPFRQQAGMVARNKEMAAVQLDQSSTELHELETIIKQKQDLLQDTVGEVVLRGDELKQYVNTLRTKSSVYKQRRAELAAIKADVSDLQQTLDNLKQQDPTLTLPSNNEQLDDNSLDASITPRPDSSLDTYGVTELARLVDGLQRAVNAARERVAPLSQNLLKLREKILDLKEQHEAKKQTYNSLNATLNTEASTMTGDIAEVDSVVKKLEKQWQDMKTEYERIELLLQKAREEIEENEMGQIKNRKTLKDTLNEQIQDEEIISKSLSEQIQLLKYDKENGKLQQEMWADLSTLLSIKIQCYRDAKQADAGGTLVVNKGAETFTLQ